MLIIFCKHKSSTLSNVFEIIFTLGCQKKSSFDLKIYCFKHIRVTHFYIGFQKIKSIGQNSIFDFLSWYDFSKIHTLSINNVIKMFSLSAIWKIC